MRSLRRRQPIAASSTNLTQCVARLEFTLSAQWPPGASSEMAPLAVRQTECPTVRARRMQNQSHAIVALVADQADHYQEERIPPDQQI